VKGKELKGILTLATCTLWYLRKILLSYQCCTLIHCLEGLLYLFCFVFHIVFILLYIEKNIKFEAWVHILRIHLILVPYVLNP
jgi:hypothetical protein